MSSPVTTFQTLGITAQPAVSAAVSTADAPEQLQSLPAGTVLPAVVTPSRSPAELPVITVTLPDGEEISFSAKLPHVPNIETPVSLKILPPETKDLLTFKIHFSAPLPNIKEAAQALQSVSETRSAVIESPAKPITVQAFVLKSVPEQITALMPELDDGIPLPVLAADSKVNIELRPDQNATTALGRPETPVVPSDLQNIPTPRTPADEVVKVIELPKDIPADSRTVFGETPTAVFSAAAGTEKTFSPAAQTQPLPPDLQPQSSFVSGKEQVVSAAVLPTQEIPLNPATDFSAAVTEQQPAAAAAEVKNIPAFPLKMQPPVPSEPEQAPPSFPVKEFPQADSPAQSRPPGTNVPAFSEKPVFRQEQPFLSAPAAVRGVIFYSQTDHQPLIATKIGVLAVEENIRLPHLTPVIVKIFPLPDRNEPPVMPKDSLPEFKNTWTVLTNALETLRQTDTAAFEAVKNILPQTGNKLPALMLSFMNAAAQGVSFTSFIGEANVSALRATEKGERLLKRLEKEFSASPKKATDGQNVWKGWDIPFLSGSVVEPVSLYLQRPSDSDPQRNASLKNQRGVRFVLDLNLTSLGKLQMEGLARRTERRFDLILRHQNDLPSSFDASVQSIFIQTLSALNYTGTIKVDQTDDFIVFAPHQDNNIKRGVLV